MPRSHSLKAESSSSRCGASETPRRSSTRSAGRFWFSIRNRPTVTEHPVGQLNGCGLIITFEDLPDGRRRPGGDGAVPQFGWREWEKTDDELWRMRALFLLRPASSQTEIQRGFTFEEAVISLSASEAGEIMVEITTPHPFLHLLGPLSERLRIEGDGIFTGEEIAEDLARGAIDQIEAVVDQRVPVKEQLITRLFADHQRRLTFPFEPPQQRFKFRLGPGNL